MRNKSIDGLQRRPKQTVGKVEVKKTAKKAKKEPETAIIEERETTITSVTPEHEEAVRDFLSSVQDSNPTDLIGLPPEKEESNLSKKERKKAAKRAKKSKSKQPKKKHKVRRIVLIVVGVLIAIVLGIGVWAFIMGNDFISRVTGGGNLLDFLTSDPDTPLKTDPKSGRTNVLIFGTEGYSMDDPNYDGGWLTDSMMVASINQETGDIKTVSLPRDLKSNTCTSTSKLNEVYYCVYSKNDGSDENRKELEKQGARALADEAQKILGVEIQYFVHVNWAALIRIIDSIGGVDVAFVYQGTDWSGNEVAIETTSKKGLADQYDKNCACYRVNYENGKSYHLNGTQALAVARARNAYGGWGASGGNFSREIFQQKIIQATIMKAKETNFATDFVAALGIKDAVGDNVRMDFQDTELKTLFKLAGNIDIGSMQTISLVNPPDNAPLLTTSCKASNGISYVCPTAGLTTYTDIHKYITRKFSSDPAVSENAEISVMNATTVSGLAANEGKKIEAKGFNVVETTNAPAALKDLTGYTVYQINKSMTNTAKFLTDLYDVKITTTIPDSLKNSKSDFVVIVGNGYDTKQAQD